MSTSPKTWPAPNQGARPSEISLAALATCHEVTYRLYADAMDIHLRDIAVSVTGVSDARGFFNVEEGIPAGFSEIYGDIKIESDASDEDIERLREAVNLHCPVLDDLRKPMKIELTIKRTKK